MYSIKEIDKHVWEAYLLTQPFTPFVQSYHYGEFYKSLGEKADTFGLFDGERMVGGSLAVSTHARRGKFVYLPNGPILDYSNK